MPTNIPLPACPLRPDDSHKGTFGTLIAVAGSRTMPGAATLIARAAFRTGVGLVKIASDASALPTILAIEPSATGLILKNKLSLTRQLSPSLAKPNTVLAIGPGLGLNIQTRQWVKQIWSMDIPRVIDADGLNVLAKLLARGMKPRQRNDSPCILTPHPGEFARLTQAMKLPMAIDPPTARQVAQATGSIVVLKTHRTIVTDGDRLAVNTTGNSAMATAGSGDVLTGVIGSLLAQGMTAWDAAILAVYLHGLAADLWVQSQRARSGLLARELADRLPLAMEQHRRLG